MLPLLLIMTQAASPAQVAIQDSLDAWVESGAAPGASLALSFDDGHLWAFASGVADQESGLTLRP